MFILMLGGFIMFVMFGHAAGTKRSDTVPSTTDRRRSGRSTRRRTGTAAATAGAAFLAFSAISLAGGPQAGVPGAEPLHTRVRLASNELPQPPLVDVMGGTFISTPNATLLNQIQNGYLAWAGVITRAHALTTPEGFDASSYDTGELILKNAVANAPEGSTFMGYSQSAGIIGMLLNQDPSVIKSGDHFVAFAPPNMPHSGVFNSDSVMNGSGLMTWLFGEHATADFPSQVDLPEGATVDVYCGEYDPICNPLPAGANNFWAWLNQNAAGNVHTAYTTNGATEFDHAVQITGPGYDGNVNFYLLPGQDAGVLPLLSWLAPWNHDLAVQWSDVLRPEIDHAYLGSGLYDAMMQLDGFDVPSI